MSNFQKVTEVPEVNLGQKKANEKVPVRDFHLLSTSYIFQLLVTSTSNNIISKFENGVNAFGAV